MGYSMPVLVISRSKKVVHALDKLPSNEYRVRVHEGFTHIRGN